MGSVQLESRPLYGIGTVARLTGVKPDTLRVWERRYDLGASHKSASGRRQYTQADLEHLQLVSALVSSGTRIGEIAKSERRTLEMLLKNHGGTRKGEIPEAKPRIVFLGDALCDWLEEHQGCLVNIDARLAPCSLAELDPGVLENPGDVDGLVVECGTLGAATLEKISSLKDVFGTENILVLHRFGNARWLQQLEQSGYTASVFPPDPAFLAFHLTRTGAEKASSAGSGNLGELVQVKSRVYNETELTAARKLQSAVDCECPRHITDLVRALATFEDYSASCSVENWQDAALHACVYAYAGQARWLMEKALGLVIDSHPQVEAQK
jgi:DNA-binding transcriptional MerR regulator